MPTIDLPTLFQLSTALFGLMAAMFFVTWTQDRRIHRPMLHWAAAYAMGIPACVLLALRGEIAPWLSIGLANVAVLVGFGQLLAGTLVFEGRRPHPILAFGGAALWILANQTTAIGGDFSTRVVFMSLLIFAHAAAASLLLWQGRRVEPLPTRRLAVGVLAVVAVTHLARILLTFGDPVQESFAALGRGWTAFISLQILLQTVLLGYALMALVKERGEFRQRMVAEIDSLTGVFTRRTFLDKASLRLAARRDRGALLIFDLDRFKAINDTHGHPAGDRVLVVFAEVVAGVVGPDDVVGRLGGEEFAVFLADADFVAAWRIADEVRRSFAGRDIRHGGRPIAATVSVGVAAVPLIEPDLARLLASADAGLYAAKHSGRDRVGAEGSADRPRPPPTSAVRQRRLP